MIIRCLKTGYLRAIQAGDILGEEEFTVGFLDQERPKPLLRFKGSFLTETGWGRPEQVGVTGKQKAGEKENKRKKKEQEGVEGPLGVFPLLPSVLPLVPLLHYLCNLI